MTLVQRLGGALLALVAGVAHAGSVTPSGAVDVAAEIREAMRRTVGVLNIPAATSVQRLDQMLLREYGATGRISGEGDARLKALYVQSAHLLMNGYPIAGGTVAVIAQQNPAFGRSKPGPALARFINAMLAPTGEPDDDLGPLAARSARARLALGPVRPALRMGAELRVMGAVYGDVVAIEAGTQVLRKQGASAGELAAVSKALAVAGVK